MNAWFRLPAMHVFLLSYNSARLVTVTQWAIEVPPMSGLLVSLGIADDGTLRGCADRRDVAVDCRWRTLECWREPNAWRR
jgi:hypothetical protein